MQRFLLARRVPVVALLLAGLAACETPRTSLAPFSGTPTAHHTVVPAAGTSSTLDVGEWNLEWFGATNYGPTDEALQYQNVKDVLSGLDIDIWGVEEVVDKTEFAKLVSEMPAGYAGLLANDPSVTDGAAYYSDFSDTEQKVGIIYKTSMASVRSARLILTANNNDFAGRPPLEVKMTVTLNGATEDLVLIVLHAKAGSARSDWDQRYAASTALKAYLDTAYTTQRVLVIGDFNDDVDKSITLPKDTPYRNFVDDAARYVFPTKELTDAGVASTVSYSDMIDHHLATNEEMSDYIAHSAVVLRPDQYIANYGTTTSDHYPTMTQYIVGGSSSGGNLPPTARFTSSCSLLSCTFTDGSTDADGTIASHSWNFGDGGTSTATNPSHSYAAGGTYTVTETVTDNAGASSSVSSTVTVSATQSVITLSLKGYKKQGYDMVDLTWSGASGSSVDIYRDGAKLTTTPNDGAYTDNTKKSGTASFTYKVCEAGTSTCSASVSISF